MFLTPTAGAQGDTAQHAASERQSGGADDPLPPRGGVYLLPYLYAPLVELEGEGGEGSAGGT